MHLHSIFGAEDLACIVHSAIWELEPSTYRLIAPFEGLVSMIVAHFEANMFDAHGVCNIL